MKRDHFGLRVKQTTRQPARIKNKEKKQKVFNPLVQRVQKIKIRKT